MKVCVSLRDHSPANPRHDNLRSEGRWERQVLEACVENPEVTELYTVGSSWDGSSPKYKGNINKGKASECILLMQDWNASHVNNYRYKAAIINIFSGPWVEQIDEVKSALSNYGGNIFFTMGFPVMYRNELGADSRWGNGVPGKAETTSHLEKFLPRENILLLPVPAAPYVSQENNFDKTNLLWVSRLIFMQQMAQSSSLLWSLKKLEQDPSLTLDVLTGWFKQEVKDYVNDTVVYRPDIVSSFWELEVFAPYVAVRDRVRIHLDLHWEQILSMYSGSKLLTTYGKMFGGPPVEAGMHGIPFVGSGKELGALCDTPEYQSAETEDAACVILDKLLTDRDFYTMIGNAYRGYVTEHYTYEAFNKNLMKLLSDRNLL